MASSDTTVEVKISATLDPSLQASTAAAKAQINDLSATSTASAQQMAAALAATGGDLSKVTPEMLGLGAATTATAEATATAASTMTAARAATDGLTVSTSRLSREAVVLTRELVAGNYSRLPGSLIVLGEAFSGLSITMLAAAGAGAAVVAGLAYMEYESLVSQKELDNLTESFRMTGRGAQFTSDNISYLRDFFEQLPGVSNDAATAFLKFASVNADVNSVLTNQVGQLLPAFVDMHGKQAPEAAGKLLKALSDLSEEGFRKLDDELLNLSPTEYETIENLIKTGDTAKAVQRILADLSAQSGIYIKSLGDQVYDTEQKIKHLKEVLESGALESGSAYAAMAAELAKAQQALANLRSQEAQQGRQGADQHYKDQYKDAEKLNESLDKQGQITKQIATYQNDLNEARKRGDSAGVAQFTQAIANEQAKLAEQQVSANEKIYRDFVAKEDAKAQAFKSGAQQRITIAQQEADKAAQLFGTESSQYAQAMGRLAAEKRQAAQQGLQAQKEADRKEVEALDQSIREMSRIRAQDLDTDLRIGQMRIQAEKSTLDQQLRLHQITAEERYAILAELTKKEAALEVDRLQQDQKDNASNVQIYDADAQKIRLINEKLEEDLAALKLQETIDVQQQLQEQARAYRSMVQEITGAERQLISSILQGRRGLTNSLLQFIGTLLQREIEADATYLTKRLFFTQAELAAQKSSETGGLLIHLLAQQQQTQATATNVATRKALNATENTDFLSKIPGLVAQWLGFETAKTAATATGAATRTTAEATAAVTGNALMIAAGAGQIAVDAAVAAAGAYAATAMIPYVGPIIAPAAAATAYGAVMSMESGLALGSAEGGAWEVGGGLWQLHPEESVLPANVANPMRDFFEGGNAGNGGGVTINNNISAMDGRSVVKTLRDRSTLRSMAKSYGAYMALNPSARGRY